MECNHNHRGCGCCKKRDTTDKKKPERLVKPIVHYGHRMRLFCRTGHFLSILPIGQIESEQESSINSVVEFNSAGFGEVRIRGVMSNLYLAMNENGILYGQDDPREEGTIFIESPLGQYNTYLSFKYAHMGWYVGIKKSGLIKPGARTLWGQKAIQFLPMRTTDP